MNPSTEKIDQKTIALARDIFTKRVCQMSMLETPETKTETAESRRDRFSYIAAISLEAAIAFNVAIATE